MTVRDLEQYLTAYAIVTRVLVNPKNHSVTFRMHPKLIEIHKEHLLCLMAVGTIFQFKPMRLWDYWKCRNKMIVIG